MANNSNGVSWSRMIGKVSVVLGSLAIATVAGAGVIDYLDEHVFESGSIVPDTWWKDIVGAAKDVLSTANEWATAAINFCVDGINRISGMVGGSNQWLGHIDAIDPNTGVGGIGDAITTDPHIKAGAAAVGTVVGAKGVSTLWRDRVGNKPKTMTQRITSAIPGMGTQR